MNEDNQNQLLEYLYGELSPSERMAFKRELDADGDLSRDLLQFIQLRQLVQEHLPEKKAPKKLTKKVLSQLGIRRPWYEVWTEGFFRPALVGAAVLLLTLGITYQFKFWGGEGQQVSQLTSKPMMPQVHPDAELKFSDLLLANRPLQPTLDPRYSRPLIGRGFAAPGMVSLASVGGGTPHFGNLSGLPTADTHDLKLEAEMAVAGFAHKQALRLRNLGDFEGAAQLLAKVIREHPAYPYKLEALAQRVDCLFKSGDRDLAQKELAWLKELSPSLGVVVESRWGD